MSKDRKLDDSQLSKISGAGDGVDFQRGSGGSGTDDRQVAPSPRPAPPAAPKGIDLEGDGTSGSGNKSPVG